MHTLHEVYRRSKYSKPMMPDALYSANKYIIDAEKRIGWRRFWGRGKKDGWWAFSRSPSVTNFPALDEFFQGLRAASIPQPLTTGNKLANTYSSFEVMRLLSFSMSVPFKHMFKLIGDVSNLGLVPTIRAVPEAAKMAAKIWLDSPGVRALAGKLGIKRSIKRGVLHDSTEAYLHQGTLLSSLADLEVGYTLAPGYLGKFDAVLNTINKPGSVPVRGIEALDRGVSFLASLEMAGKRGMTAQQATFGIYSTILKNNFLSGPLNPAWARSPKVRALFLFQKTAFNILERRLNVALKTGKAVKLAWADGKTVIKEDGVGEALRQLTDVRRFVKGAEHEFKKNVIADALGSQRDIYGRAVSRQLMREIVLVGGVISGGNHLGIDLMPHTFHIPFLTHSKTDPTLATSPAAKASLRTFNDWREAEEDDREFIAAQFIKNWLGSTRGMPLIINKGLRISENDIPAIYEEGKFPSWLKYIFSVPGRERD